MFQALINGRVHVDSCLPDDNSSAVRLLRQIMDDSVADVSCCEMSEEAASMDSTDPVSNSLHVWFYMTLIKL